MHAKKAEFNSKRRGTWLSLSINFIPCSSDLAASGWFLWRALRRFAQIITLETVNSPKTDDLNSYFSLKHRVLISSDQIQLCHFTSLSFTCEVSVCFFSQNDCSCASGWIRVYVKLSSYYYNNDNNYNYLLHPKRQMVAFL